MPANPFDSLQKTAYEVVSNTMGYDATWNPLDESDPITARVLLNKPTQGQKITDVEYDAMSPRMEFFEGDFPGLYESIRENNSEPITINGLTYHTLRAERLFDGKTISVRLSKED